MSVETIIRHYPPQIGMTDKEHSKEVIDFSLVPVRAVIERRDAWDRRGFIGIGLNPYPTVVPDTQQIVDNFETIVAARIVDCCDVGNHGVLSGGVVFEK